MKLYRRKLWNSFKNTFFIFGWRKFWTDMNVVFRFLPLIFIRLYVTNVLLEILFLLEPLGTSNMKWVLKYFEAIKKLTLDFLYGLVCQEKNINILVRNSKNEIFWCCCCSCCDILFLNYFPQKIIEIKDNFRQLTNWSNKID